MFNSNLANLIKQTEAIETSWCLCLAKPNWQLKIDLASNFSLIESKYSWYFSKILSHINNLLIYNNSKDCKLNSYYNTPAKDDKFFPQLKS